MALQTKLDTQLNFPCTITTNESDIKAGGATINQAIAAARSGAKSSVIGITGNDLFGKTIIETLRHEGITTSGIAKNDLDTGVINSIIDKDNKCASILMTGANKHLTSKIISNNSLNERTLLILQSDLPHDISLSILKRAKTKAARAIMVITNNISDELFDYLDIAIINNDTHAPPNIKSKLITTNHKNLAFDSFCGTFAACVQAGLTSDRAEQYANAAAALTAQNKQLPYLDDIKSQAC